MRTFKIGDTVRRICGDYNSMRVGDTSVVMGFSSFNDLKLKDFEGNHSYDYFELVKEAPTFNLKTSPWFIRVNNKEEFNTINEWLEVNFGARLLSVYSKYLNYLTNTEANGFVVNRVMWSTEKSKGTKEIKLSIKTKTTIDSVEYPEVKTQQEVDIEELEATIELAKQQILKLKEGK